MLAKSLKYDLRAVYKLWLIFTATIIGISFVGALSMRSLVVNSEFTVYTLFAMGGVMLSISAFSIYTLGVNILVFYRYYQNFFTDEAYLTFTLPVKRSTLFNSKLLCSLIFSAASMAVSGVCILILMSMTPVSQSNPELLIFSIAKTIFNLYDGLLKDLGAWLIIYTILGLLIYIATCVFSTMLLFFCVTLGATMVRKYKLLMAILVYYLVNMAISVISYVLSIVLGLTTIGSVNALITYSPLQLEIAVMLGLIGILAFFVVLCVLIYKFCLSRIERNLNLA